MPTLGNLIAVADGLALVNGQLAVKLLLTTGTYWYFATGPQAGQFV